MYWNPIYIILLLFTTVLDFYISLYLTSSESSKTSRTGLVLSLIISLTILISFKYIGFFLSVSQQTLALIGVDYVIPEMSLILPLGISFYTFQSIGYAIDVYRKEIKPEKNFFMFSLFISYFPQLVSGPIEKAEEILPQLKNKSFSLSSGNIKTALFYILWGLFLKNVIADNAAFIVDSIFTDITTKDGGKLVYGSVLFTFQIYADFAGYSFMAVGISKLFDIQLMSNFNSPLLSVSLTDFWRRWHMSLSRWFQNYVFSPLIIKWRDGGKLAMYGAIIITFMIIGLWHGAEWNFIIFGFLNGAILVLEFVTKKMRKKIISYLHPYIAKSITILLTFSLITLLLILFHVRNMEDLGTIYKKIFTLNWRELVFWFVDGRYNFAFIGVFIMLCVELFLNRKALDKIITIPIYIFYPFCLLLFFSIVFLSRFEGAQFIYFQF